jgi:ATP-binding cassette subfamily B protein
MNTTNQDKSTVQVKAPSLVLDIIRALILVWKTQPAYALLSAILAFLQGLTPAIQLWVSKLIIDMAARALQTGTTGYIKSLSGLLMLVGLQAGLLFLGTLFTTAQETIRPLLGELLGNKLNLKIIDKTNSLEIPFFENDKFYDKLQIAYQGAGSRPLEIVFQLFTMMQTIIAFFSMAAILIRLNWATLLLVAGTMVPILLLQNHYSIRNYLMLRARAPDLRKQQYLGMVLTSNWFIKELRVFHLEELFTNLYRSHFDKFYFENRRLLFKQNTSLIFASVGYYLGWFLTAGYIVIRLINHTVTIGDLALYTQAISATQGQIQSILVGISSLYSSSLFLHNMFEFLCLPARNLSEGLTWMEDIQEIEFQDVSFSYPGTREKVLDKISFKVQRGQSLALVGKNGTGKTTLVKLLCRLYEPTSGRILVNGKNLVEYSPRSFQNLVAVLFQDYGRYYLTARENIGIGHHPEINNLQAIESAAERGGADTLVRNLSNNYETVLGRLFDEGVELSGGEWQRVALSRGYMRKGQVLILDEPTASLDAEAEMHVFEGLTQQNNNQITFLISHRFSTVRMADKILVLDKGHVSEMGSHAELMACNGQYAYLFKLQARGYKKG